MRALRSPLTLFLFLAAVAWVFAPAVRADRIGSPYRGPSELTGSGSGQDTGDSGGGDTGGGDTGGGDSGGGDGGGGDGGGGDSGGSTGPAPGAGAGAGRGAGQATLDGWILWQWWWEHNKDRFLADATESGRVNMGSAYYWFGGGAKYPPRDITLVSDTQRRTPAFTTLKDVLEHDKAAEVRAEAAIAMGRLGTVAAQGDEKGKEGLSDNLVVRELIQAIEKDSNADVRHSAILGLGISADRDGCVFLLRNYARLDIEARAYANIALGLARYIEAIPHLLDHLPKSGTDRSATTENIAAIHAIGLLPDDANRATVVEELTKEGREGVQQLEKLLDRRGIDAIVTQTVQTLSRLQVSRKEVQKTAGARTSEDIKWSAILGLCNYYADEKDAKEAADELQGKSGFKSGSGQDKVFAVLAMGELARRLDATSKVRADIVKFLKKEALDSRKNKYTRSASCIALAVAGDRTAIPDMAELFSDSTADHYELAAASVGLGLLRATEHTDTIKNEVMLKSRWDPDARGYAALGIALMGDTTRVDELRDFLRSESQARIRRQCTLALGVLGDSRHIKEMIKFFAKDWKKQQTYEVANAAYGLAWIRDQSAVEDLAKMAKDNGDPMIRGMACIALGYSAARDRVNPLTRCYENQSFRNRFANWELLYAISRIL